MTAGVIPDVAITADVITTAADAAITVAVADGELPCLAAETAAPAFSGSSAFCAAAAITDAVITMAVAMTAAGSSSFFCSAAEIMDVAATTAVKKIRRKGRGYFLCPFCPVFFLRLPVSSFFLPDTSDLSHKKHSHQSQAFAFFLIP